MSELIPINLVIGDRTYRIKTLPKDEEVIRHTIKIINDKIIEFKTQFAGKDMQDFIAMVLIWYATQGVQESNPIRISGGSNLIKKAGSSKSGFQVLKNGSIHHCFCGSPGNNLT